jgi:hypothetical protein
MKLVKYREKWGDAQPTFFGAPRLEVVVVFFAVVVFALPASAFFGAGGFFVAAVLEVVAFLAGTGFAAALDLAAVVLVDVFAAFGFGAAAFGLAAGLFYDKKGQVNYYIRFSLLTSLAADVSAGLALGASLTRPEGPEMISVTT